jgi:hypothetical protein
VEVGNGPISTYFTGIGNKFDNSGISGIPGIPGIPGFLKIVGSLLKKIFYLYLFLKNYS